MAYKYWKLMEKVGVAVCSKKPEVWRGEEQFDGYLFEVGDKNGQERAEEWARRYDNKWDKDKETITYEPDVHIFDNEAFTVTILDSAGGSSQGGRLSFWKCRVEKDGVQFVVGVNDSILADLIRHSDIKDGTVQQKVMFARQGGQPGFIHKDMEAYEEATADMKKKADMKAMKKTSKWELGGVYSSITITDVCLGPVWDTLEEVPDPDSRSWYSRTKLVKREKPIEVTAWVSFSDRRHPDGAPQTLEEFMKDELKDEYLDFRAGKPPARARTHQMEVKESDQKLLDEFFKKITKRYAERYQETPRYVRKIK